MLLGKCCLTCKSFTLLSSGYLMPWSPHGYSSTRGTHSAVYRVRFEYVSQSSSLNPQCDSIEKWDPPELIRSRHLCLLEIFAFLAPLEVDT